MQIVVDKSGYVLAKNPRYAASFWSRSVGLLGLSGMHDFDALILPSCKAIHMYGMRFAIDVLFCSADNRVVHLIEEIKPWRFSPYIRAASFVIELPSGTLKRVPSLSGRSIECDDLLRIE